MNQSNHEVDIKECPLIPITNFCSSEQEVLIDRLGARATFHDKSDPKINEIEVKKKAFKKRRRSKAITVAMSSKLAALDNDRKKGYFRAYHCAEVMYQEGKKITSGYCGHRCCVVCNRIKSARMMQGYAEPLLNLPDIHFLTLTSPNVEAGLLSDEINRMLSVWRKIYRNIKINYKGLDMRGMYKLECTYNYKSKTYNPHLHFIVSTGETAKEIKRQWLKNHKENIEGNEAKEWAQDLRKADKNSLHELFKYVTKSVVNKNYSATAMDVMYEAMSHRNTYYRMGVKKIKAINDDIEDLSSQIIEFKSERIDLWKWCNDISDWYSTTTGELFIEKKLRKKTQRIVDVINNSSDEIQCKDVKSERDIFNQLRKTRDVDKIDFEIMYTVHKSDKVHLGNITTQFYESKHKKSST